MSLVALIGFLALTGVAAYTQTLTGFAFGLITMGGVGLTGLLSLPDAALIVSVLTFVNATQMLLKGWRDVAWREFRLVMLTSIPMLFVGYWLLEWLAGTRADLLRFILGLVIIVSSLQLARKPDHSPGNPAMVRFCSSAASPASWADCSRLPGRHWSITSTGSRCHW